MQRIVTYSIVGILALGIMGYLWFYVLAPWLALKSGENGPTACTMEARVCADGTVVGRSGPDCSFAPCPSEGGDGRVRLVADNLSIPWGLAFLPDGNILFSERAGTLTELNPITTERHAIAVPETVRATGEGGLLGVTLHPAFEANRFVYLYITTEENGSTMNKVMRYTYVDRTLTAPITIIDGIPGAPYHDGGRMAFGPDGLLYITTGDATAEESAQDTNALSGKILRLRADGSIPEDNPFGDAVYSYGHRNPQGLAWDAEGDLWSTEHGRSGIRSGLDELNLIERGANYGWPESEGDMVRENTVGPVVHSGPDVTWAPASAAFSDGSIFFGGLRGQTLYEAVLDNTNAVVELKEHFAGTYGRLRTVVVGPDDFLYVTTSNGEGTDKILRIDPTAL